MARLRRVGFELRPQRRDVVVYRARRRHGLIPPDLIEQFLARDDLAGARREVPQDAEFLLRHVDWLARLLRFVPLEIDDDVVEPQYVDGWSDSLRPAKERPDTRQQLADRKWLRQI